MVAKGTKLEVFNAYWCKKELAKFWIFILRLPHVSDPLLELILSEPFRHISNSRESRQQSSFY